MERNNAAPSFIITAAITPKSISKCLEVDWNRGERFKFGFWEMSIVPETTEIRRRRDMGVGLPDISILVRRSTVPCKQVVAGLSKATK